MTATQQFVEIPGALLRQIADDSNRIPRLYYASNPLLRKMFWRRLSMLTRLIDKQAGTKRACLDFGGGSGVLLPTLAARFASLTLVDLEARQAAVIQAHYQLKNVQIVQGDIACVSLSEAPFDAAVAADVLEHFKDLSVPVNALRKFLKPGGLLFTSLPTESAFYQLLRKVFGIQKPWDHYHTGGEVEQYLQSNGFERVATSYVPLGLPILPLFLVSAWKVR